VDEQRLKQEMTWLGLPAPQWSFPLFHPEGEVLDVAIIGAGMSGLAVAAALKLKGLQPTVFDKAPAGLEGPWLTTALMETLRSPKNVVGPALDLPSLTFAAWYQAQYGIEAWDDLDKISRQEWARYLHWYRDVMDIEVRSEHEVLEVLPRDDKTVELIIFHAGNTRRYLTRRVILALGLEGFGRPDIPSWVDDLPRNLWTHSIEALDYSTLRGKRVAVVGASAAAMDCAATALESDAEAVELLIRRPTIPHLNRAKGAGSAGLTHAYRQLPDAWKWRLSYTIAKEQIAPPRGSTLRVTRHQNVFINTGCPVTAVREEANAVTLTTPKGEFVVDHLILATGFRLDWAKHTAYASFANELLLWRHRFTPSSDEANDALGEHPYLGSGFEFQSRAPDAVPGLDRIHCFCLASTLSMGHVIGAIPNTGLGAKQLAEIIAGKLYQEDEAQHFQKILDYEEPELFGDEWIPALPPSLRNQSSN
jgi:cation diffusion facilitator CzcD-associated flavoprotein CzcO